MYSCALWSEAEGGVNGDLESGPTPGDLEAAQLRKIRHVLTKARIQSGHRVLEFGTGWGGLAIEVCATPKSRGSALTEHSQAARTYGCEVDTLTLSKEQKALAEERVRKAGLQGRVRVHLLDYRDIPAEFEHQFDAFISIEMLEHVGAHVSASIYAKRRHSCAFNPVLQKVLPACRFCSQTTKCHGRRDFINIPGGEIFWVSVRCFVITSLYGGFSSRAPGQKTSCASTCGQTHVFPPQRHL